jgi:hypothetical protein
VKNVSATTIALAENEITEATNCAKMQYGGLVEGIAIPNFDQLAQDISAPNGRSVFGSRKAVSASDSPHP